MTDHHALDEQPLQRLPLPLAQLCRRAQNAKTPLERHLAAYYLWEAALKLLGATAIVEYAESNDRDPELADRLQNLARPSVGHWWEFVRCLLPVLAERGDKGFTAVRDLVLGRARDDLPRAAGLYAALVEMLDGRGGARCTVRLKDLFDHLVAYRNREIGHGAASLRSGDFHECMGPTLFLGLSELLRHLDVLAGRRLICVGDVRRSPVGWSVERYALVGEAATRVDPLQLPDADVHRLPRPHRVYLESARGPAGSAARVSLLPLHALIRCDADGGKVFFLNARRGKEQVEYLCYSSGDVLRDEAGADEHRDLLGRLVSGPVHAEAAGAWAARSLAEEPPASSAPAPPAERSIGEFELLSRLGQGGMGVVYRAWQPSLGRQVALKCMLRGGDPKAEARFAREIRALGRVEHPNVVKVFTSGSEGDQWFYAMELIEGAELSRICDQLAGNDATVIDEHHWRRALSTACEHARSQETPLSDSRPAAPRPTPAVPLSSETPAAPVRPGPGPNRQGHVEKAVEIIRQVAEAVHALHEAGVVHRDIKPGNIMLAGDGSHPVLLDLGLAQLADEADKRLTRTRQFVGTLRYASPEQVLAVGGVDGRSDVYSLGATLWELLTLRPMFGADESMPTPELMLRIQGADPEGPRKYNPRVPHDLEAIVNKCLQKNPAARYATARELAADLGRWQGGEVVLAERPTRWHRLRRWARRRRQPILWAAAVLTALGVGVGVATWAGHDRGAAPSAGPAAEDPLVELRRAEVRREVDSLRRQPPEILRAHPAAYEEAEVLPPVDYSAFEILSDERLVDLRGWKPVPPDRPDELVCATTMVRRLRLRKLRPADELRFEARTTGAELFVSCPSHPGAFRAAGQKARGFVGGKATKVRQMTVDVRDVAPQAEFSVRTVSTYWNSLQKDDDLWFGAIGYENSFKVSLLIVFPPGKPFKDYRLMVAPTKEDKPRPFEGRKVLLAAEDNDWIYWEVPEPGAGYVYSLFWSW